MQWERGVYPPGTEISGCAKNLRARGEIDKEPRMNTNGHEEGTADGTDFLRDGMRPLRGRGGMGADVSPAVLCSLFVTGAILYRDSCPSVSMTAFPCPEGTRLGEANVHNRRCLSRRVRYLRIGTTPMSPPGGRHFRA